jgi:DNA-binding NarL/FixJ family response regulator
MGDVPQKPRPRVLLADDHAGMLSALQRMLEPSCDVVGRVMDGRALLEAAGRYEPDVIVLDVTMPEIDGLEACRQIMVAAPNTRIVFLTAHDDAAVRQRALSLGASAFVLKYRAWEQLLPAIQRAYFGSDAPAELA